MKLQKQNLNRIEQLLKSQFLVIQYHKTLLTSIKNNSLKNNLSKSDYDIFETISNQYPQQF
jgi:hypothetical protein